MSIEAHLQAEAMQDPPAPEREARATTARVPRWVEGRPPPAREDERGAKDLVARDPLVRNLNRVIQAAVRAMAVLMTFAILFGVVDVAWTIGQKLLEEPRFVLTVSDILATFGAFMAVLIAIEIFVNIVLYLRDDVIHVKIVMATALMAIARKVIVLDYEKLEADYIWATAGAVLAMSIGYGIVQHFSKPEHARDLHV